MQHNDYQKPVLAIHSGQTNSLFNFSLFFTGRRKNSKLLYSIDEQQLYYKKNALKKYTTFSCTEKKCDAQIQMFSDGECRKPMKCSNHNHAQKEDEYKYLRKRWIKIILQERMMQCV